ncbi:hypothetical protein [Anaeromyxobacter oryzae]|uniref:Uncharacterized protein n=1 Tax=Anaeromyxobacter oryzae TaxID=2918170 RepID=A0ABM7WZI0_9BACT|nr:hypothetical protein [Anaeromyxobacter oryzae]BDG04946.1 hypothetical protein AMOR_39420 [Anaeromyxobacter oryzae]
MKFARRDIAATVRDALCYHSGVRAEAGDPEPPALPRDVIRAIQLGDDAPTDPMARAKAMLDAIASVREAFAGSDRGATGRDEGPYLSLPLARAALDEMRPTHKE